MLEWKGLQNDIDDICLKELSWNCRIEHLHCRLQSKQVYINTSEDSVEAVYTFALPRNAVVTDFSLEMGGKRLQAEIAKPAEASDRYEKALEEGDMPAMIEYSESGLCTVEIGGIAPAEQVVVEIACEWIEPQVGDTVRITIPTVVAERYSKDGSQGDLLPHQYVESSAFAEYPFTAHFEFVGREYKNARFSAPGYSPSCSVTDQGAVIDIHHGFAYRDLVVTAENVAAQAQSYLLEDEGQYRGIVVLPLPGVSGTASRKNLALSLVVDCSGSMAGAAIAEARRALASLPDLLTENDTLTLTLFGNTQRVPFSRPQACTKAFFRKDYLPVTAAIDADMGGTEMGAALEKAAGLAGAPTDVLLITDGEIWDEESCIDIARRSGQRVYVIGIGSAANGTFCSRIASATGGSVEMVLPSEDMTAAAARMIERMRRPPLQVKSFTPAKRLFQSDPLKLLHSDETLVLFLRYAKLPAQIPTLVLEDGSRQIAVEGAAWKLSTVRGLRMLAANSELVDGNLKDAEDFAIRHGLLSKFTNMILVNEREPAKKNLAQHKLQRIPQMIHGFTQMLMAPFTSHRPAVGSSRCDSHHLQGPSNISIDDVWEAPLLKIANAFKKARLELPLKYCRDLHEHLVEGFGFDDTRRPDRLRYRANLMSVDADILYFFFLLWREETEGLTMPGNLEPLKSFKSLQLDKESKDLLWDLFENTCFN